MNLKKRCHITPIIRCNPRSRNLATFNLITKCSNSKKQTNKQKTLFALLFKNFTNTDRSQSCVNRTLGKHSKHGMITATNKQTKTGS